MPYQVEPWADWIKEHFSSRWCHWGVWKDGHLCFAVFSEYKGDATWQLHLQAEMPKGKTSLTWEQMANAVHLIGHSLFLLDLAGMVECRTLLAELPDYHKPLTELVLQCGLQPVGIAPMPEPFRGRAWSWVKFQIDNAGIRTNHGRA